MQTSTHQKPFQLSVKALLLNDRQECLVLRRSPASNNNPGLWDLPGGKCDPGETMDAALRREVAEETGLNIRVGRVVGSTQWELPERVVAYLLLETSADNGEVTLSDEHVEFRWMPRGQLATLEYPPQFREFLCGYAQAAPPPRSAVQPDWYHPQVRQFRDLRPSYKQLAETLLRVLDSETQALGIHAIVQARAKTLASFAEKIQRPNKNYSDPLNQLTDLCGARVIVHTLSEVAAVCRLVEERFQIFREDSGDKSELLGASEFGYLSRHYIVSLKPGMFSADVAPDDLVQRGLKAEIQVRTILQHAWADTAHELSYKNSFKLPRRWQREFARLAAVLEEADRGFEEIAAGLKEYASSYGAYLDRSRLQQEVQRHQLILEVDPGNQGVAHHLAKLAMSLDNWQLAVDVLRPFAATNAAAVLRDLGVSLCKLRRKEIEHADFQQGQAFLSRATEIDPHDVDAWASLAGTWRTREGREADPQQKLECRRQAKTFYRRAFQIDHGNPYPLGNYIEYEVADHPRIDIASFFGPSLEAASQRCVAQAQVGVNLPWAYFDLGKFSLLLARPHAALGYYAKGASLSPTAFFLSSALGSFDTLQAAADTLPGFAWSRDFLRLVKSFRFGEHDEQLPPASLPTSPTRNPVVIVAGYCNRAATAAHRSLIIDGLDGFQGTVISGGTKAGISAVIGELQAARHGTLHTIGYVPCRMPDDVKLDERYAEQRLTTGHDFSLLEPLQYWSDLLANKTPQTDVRMVVVGGGRIAACECQMALAMGVPTAVIDVADSEVGRCLNELDWLRHPCLRKDIVDAAGLRRFLNDLA